MEGFPCHRQSRQRQTEGFVLIDDLPISTLPAFSANQGFPCEGPQGKLSELVRVVRWQKKDFDRLYYLLSFSLKKAMVRCQASWAASLLYRAALESLLKAC